MLFNLIKTHWIAFMGTYRVRNGRHQMIVEVYRNGRRFFKSKTFKSKREAFDWEKRMLYEIDNGIVTKESLKKRKFSDAIEKYIAVALPLKPKNSRNVLQHLKWWNHHLGTYALTEITPAVLAEYRDRLLTEVGPAGKVRKNNTVIRYIASLSVVLEYCMKEWMWLTQNPARSIKKPKVGIGKTRFFCQEEIRKIKDLCIASKSRFLLPIFTTALHTGMRRGEVLSLKWENIDFKNKEICLPISKNGEPRDVPMTEEVFTSLTQLANSKQITLTGLLFPSPHNSQKSIDIRSAWDRALQKAGIHDATFHTIRHTTCSFLSQLGIPQILIARIVGHKDSRTTDRYTHAGKTYTREAIDKLEILIQNCS